MVGAALFDGTGVLVAMGVLVAIGGLIGGGLENEIRSCEGAAGAAGSMFVAAGIEGGSALRSVVNAVKPATMEITVVFITIT